MSNPNHDEHGRFAEGDHVQITSGPEKGRHGRITEAGQHGAHVVKLYTGSQKEIVVGESEMKHAAQTEGDRARLDNAARAAYVKNQAAVEKIQKLKAAKAKAAVDAQAEKSRKNEQNLKFARRAKLLNALKPTANDDLVTIKTKFSGLR